MFFLSTIVTLVVGLLSITIPQVLHAQTSRTLWQNMVSPRSTVMQPDRCLGPLPAATALNHLQSLYTEITRGPLTRGTMTVRDPDQKMFCMLLNQYWGEWRMDIPRDKVPSQYTAVAPKEYIYTSPLAECIPADRLRWCESQSVGSEADYLLLLSVYESGCGRGRCPFVNAADHVQSDYYLISLLDKKFFGGRR